MAIKLDINKSYDRVERDFLRAMMEKMLFPLPFIDLIFCCLQLVCFQILIIGEPSQYFQLHRGIRQGDPLSPFLFLIYVEGFLGLIRS